MELKTGDKIFYSKEGICKIDKIERIKVGDEVVRYYVLNPVYDNVTKTIRIPVDQGKKLIRNHVGKKTARTVLNKLAKSKFPWINDSKKRKEFYAQTLEKNNLESYGIIALTVKTKNKEYIKLKKSMPLNDQSIQDYCQKLFIEEIAIALGVSIDKATEEFENLIK